jgi:hypothetical protein
MPFKHIIESPSLTDSAIILNPEVKGMKDTMIRGLVSRQPVLKTAVFSLLALILVIGLSWTIPSLSTEPAHVQAADIAKNNPEIQTDLGDEEVEWVKVYVIDDKATAIVKGKKGVVTADIDLKTKDVTQVVKMAKPTTVGNQEAIDLAKADPRVKELLDTGAMISIVSPMFYFGMMNVETGELEKISGTFVKVVIKGVEKNYVAYIDLSEGKVVKLIDITATLEDMKSYSGSKGGEYKQK